MQKSRHVQPSRPKIAPEGEDETIQPPIVHPMEGEIMEGNQPVKKTMIMALSIYGVLIVLGIGTGYLLSRTVGAGALSTSPKVIKTDTVAGSTDTSTFKDSADGIIEKGGIEGEGTHKLIREGGPSQTAVLVSSVVDLDEYAGKKVKVWGQTMAAKKVAWLMDVGKVEVLQ